MDQEPRFLTIEQILQLHERTLMQHGGLSGIRDLGLLEAALAMPWQKFSGVFLHEDLSAMASAYLYHIAMNHSFLDGNKRVAALSSLVFLRTNGCEMWPDPREMEIMTLAVADGKLSKPDLAEWFRKQISGNQ